MYGVEQGRTAASAHSGVAREYASEDSYDTKNCSLGYPFQVQHMLSIQYMHSAIGRRPNAEINGTVCVEGHSHRA